jgi:hypothetical protein
MVGYEAYWDRTTPFRHLMPRSGGDAPNDIDLGPLAAIPLHLVTYAPVSLVP